MRHDAVDIPLKIKNKKIKKKSWESENWKEALIHHSMGVGSAELRCKLLALSAHNGRIDSISQNNSGLKWRREVWQK